MKKDLNINQRHKSNTEETLAMKILKFRIPHFHITICHSRMDPGSMSRDINGSFILITNSFLLFLVTLHLIIKTRHIIVESVII